MAIRIPTWWMKLPDGSTINIHSMEDLPDADKYTGFVYLIRNQLTGKIYIGKKVFRNTRKKKISQRVKKATGTRKTYERQVKESDWLDYFGSSKELLADIQKHGKQYFSREIIELCCSKKYLSYAEVFWQMQFDVLRRNSYNGNILGRYYTRDMENCKS